MITLISLHNHVFSTKTAINQKVNWRLTEDMATVYIRCRPLHWSCTHRLIFFHVKMKRQTENGRELFTEHVCVTFLWQEHFWNILWEEHKIGLFLLDRSTILKSRNFTFQSKFSISAFFSSSQSQLSTTGDGKDVPLSFLGWNNIFTVAHE